MELTCEKLASDKKNLKKDIEDMKLEHNVLKATIDKLKQNNSKLSHINRRSLGIIKDFLVL